MLFMLFGLWNCEKKCDPTDISGDVHIFLVSDYELQGEGCAIDNESVILDSVPFIFYEELISYNENQYLFEIDDVVYARIAEMEHNVYGKAFALVANEELIYTGYFWPSISSLSCEWYTIDPLSISYHGGLKVKMGYPGEIPGIIDPDVRNHDLIRCIFERDGKLIN